MLKRPITLGSIFILSVFVLTFCNLPKKDAARAPAPTPTTVTLIVANTPTAENTPTVKNTPTSQPTLCDNLYQPSRLGDTWMYSGTNTAIKDYTRTETIINSTANAFTSETNISTIKYTVDYSCTAQGLVADNPVQQYLGPLLNSPGSNIGVKLNSATGISLPAQIKPGDQWQQEAKVDATINNTSTSGWVVFDYTASGLETVSVPAGTYQAMRVDIVISIQITPLRISAGTYDATYWMAPNVGIVKTEGTSHVPGVEFSDSTQLTSFTQAP